MRKAKRLVGRSAVGVGALVCAPGAWAGTTAASSAAGFVVPAAWMRGGPGSAFGLWDNSFTTSNGAANNVVYTGANLAAANVMAQASTLTGWNVRDTNANTVTSSQHFYGGGSAPVGVDVAIPGYGLGAAYATTFRVQLDTATTVVDPAAFSLSTDGGVTRTAVSATETVLPTGGPNGSTNALYEFTVPGNAASYELYFATPAGVTNANNAALNALAVDTLASTPEPSAALAGAATCAGALLTRRRRSVAR